MSVLVHIPKMIRLVIDNRFVEYDDSELNINIPVHIKKNAITIVLIIGELIKSVLDELRPNTSLLSTI